MNEFEKNTVTIYQDKGRDWLAQLPVLLNSLSQHFELTQLSPCTDLSYNYLAYGLQSDRSVVLKVGIDLAAIEQEYYALQAFNFPGMVKLLDADLSQGALLIEQLSPGRSLNSLFPHEDAAALKITCTLAKELHQITPKINYSFPHLSDWLQIIDENWDLLSKDLDLARTLKKQLLAEPTTQVLLHGDLHYGNILSNDDSWVLIDPKGVIGDPLFDLAGCLLREPLKSVVEYPQVERLLERRIQQVADDAQKEYRTVWSWTFVQTILSICWSLEDNQDNVQKQRFLESLKKVGVNCLK